MKKIFIFLLCIAGPKVALPSNDEAEPWLKENLFWSKAKNSLLKHSQNLSPHPDNSHKELAQTLENIHQNQILKEMLTHQEDMLYFTNKTTTKQPPGALYFYESEYWVNDPQGRWWIRDNNNNWKLPKIAPRNTKNFFYIPSTPDRAYGYLPEKDTAIKGGIAVAFITVITLIGYYGIDPLYEYFIEEEASKDMSFTDKITAIAKKLTTPTKTHTNQIKNIQQTRREAVGDYKEEPTSSISPNFTRTTIAPRIISTERQYRTSERRPLRNTLNQ